MAPPSDSNYWSSFASDVSGAQAAARALGAGGGADTSFIPKTINKLQDIEGQKEKAEAPTIDRLKKTTDTDQKTVDEKAAAVEPVEVKPWTEKPPETNPIQAFGSFASIFAIAASAFTHTPAINAMNAMAAGISARNAGDQRKYQEAYKAWQDNTELALKRHQVQADDMRLAMEKLHGDTAEAAAMLNVIGAKYGDQTMLAMNEAGLYEKMAQLQNARSSAAAGMTMQMLQLKEAHERDQRMWGSLPQQDSAVVRQDMEAWQADYLKTNGHPPSPDEITAHYTEVRNRLKSPNNFTAPAVATLADGSSVLVQQSKSSGQWVTADENHAPVEGVKNVSKTGDSASDDATVQQTAKMIANYQMAPLSSFVLRSKFGQQVMAEVGKVNPDYSATRYGEVSKAVRDFGTGKEGSQVRSQNVVLLHLDTLDRLTDALKNGDVRALNSLRQSFVTQFGATAPTNFDAAKNIVGQEIVKAIVAGGGGVTERQEAGEQLSRTHTWDQLKGMMNTYKDLMAGQLIGLRKQYEASTGLKNFDDMLLPETRGALARAEGQGGANSSPSGVYSVKNKSEYDLLPPGAHYRKPDDPPDSYRIKQ